MPVRIIQGQLPYTGGTGIEIDANKVISILLRAEDNLIKVDGDNELYTDLQLANNIAPNDEFPVGVTVGKVLQANGWTQSGLLLNWKTASGDYARWIYANDGKIYFDPGTGIRKEVYYSSEVDTMVQTLRNYLDQNFQPLLTAGAGITIDQNYVISAQGAGTGDVSGPNGATDGHLAVFDGATGKAIKDGGAIPTPTPVIDALNSTSTTSALSANQGKILDGKIADMMGLGKFLSLWNSTTGQPISFPLATPYSYTTGDYFIVSVVSTATPPVNYKPDGSSYTGTASSVTESGDIEIGDVYVYDGSVWLLQSNHGKTTTFANIAGQPSDNTNLANALNAKANASDLNVKAFYLASGSDLTSAQAAYDWYVAGNNPIIVYDNEVYECYFSDSSELRFANNTQPSLVAVSDGSTSHYQYKTLSLNITTDSITSISFVTRNKPYYFLETNVNYTTPYVPIYDGSPANKKYVDDSISGLSIPSISTITVTLSSANWTSKTQTVSATGVTASNSVIVSPDPSDMEDYTDAKIYCSSQGSGTLTFTCSEEPTNNIDVNVIIFN